MEKRLDDYTSDEPSETPEMSTDQSSLDNDQDNETPTVSAKTIGLNTVDLAGDDLNRKAAWEGLKGASIIDTGYEYFRRTYKEAIEGEHDVDAAVDDQIQSIIKPVLISAGLIEHADEEETNQTTEMTETETRVRTSSARKTRVEDEPSRSSEKMQVELEQLRDRIELLREQAEYEASDEETPGSRKALFIANTAIDGLDEILNQN